jgi:tight adherence protein C
MSDIYLIAYSILIAAGALFLIIGMRGEKKQQHLKKYLYHQSQETQESVNLLEWLDSIVPGSFATNEDEINQKMASAGVYSFQYSHLYLPLKFGIMMLGAVLIGILLYRDLSFTMLLGAIGTWIILILVIPDMILDARIRTYRAAISRQLPYLIDLLAVCVQTGMTIESSLSYLAREIHGFDPKLARLMGRTNERAQIVGLDKALDELYLHIPTTEMRSFVMTLKQSLQYGSSIYETLTTLSADIRQVSMLTVEERIGKLSAKMSVPLILFILLPIVILIAAPGVMRILSGDY